MTIKDIAKESGYAVGTVSRVLNNHPDVSEKARETILAVVEKHHFRLNNNAKHLKQQASKGIAIIVKGSQNMLFASIVERLQGLIEEKDFVSFIYYIGEEENEVEQAESVCLERHPKGIFFLGSNLEFFRERFARLDVPCVLVTNSAAKLSFPNLSSVSTDDAAAAEAAVEYLIQLGHERIGVLGGRMERSHAAFTRCIGCEQAFRNHEMIFDKKKQYEPALFSMEEGYHAMGALLDKMPELTAVFAMADVLAVGAIRAIRDRGLRVPEDISVIGFDGIDLGNYLTPRLTTIRQKSDRIADRSMEILYFTDKTDEFIPDIFRTYGDKAFRSAVDGDLELGDEKQPETADHQETLDFLKETLGSRVDQVKASGKLKSHPVCLTSGEGMTFEMEKYFAAVQPDLALKAKRILEVNVEHPAFAALESARITDPDRAKKYAEILLNQAMLIAGLPLENPSDYTDLVCSLWK